MSTRKICPECEAQYEDDAETCSVDGTSLVPLESSNNAPLIAIDPRYRVVAAIGTTALGARYLAEEVETRRKCVVTVVAPDIGAKAEVRTALLQRAGAAKAIVHSNVSTLLECGEGPAGLFVITENADGETLAEKLQREFAIHPDVALDVIAQVTNGLEAAHAQGIAHGAIEPSRVLLTKRTASTFHAKVLDVGIVRPSSSGEFLPAFDAAVQYQSPEQLRGEPADARSDQYSLALTAFVALTGRDAFPEERVDQPAETRLASRVDEWSRAKQDVQLPNALHGVFERALSVDASMRFDSVVELHAALAAALGSMSTAQTAAFYRRALEARIAATSMKSQSTESSAPPAAAVSEALPPAPVDPPPPPAAPKQKTAEVAAVVESRPAPRKPKKKRAVNFGLIRAAVLMCALGFVVGFGAWAVVHRLTLSP